jgi:very-short-patch-repair endonuclease
MVHKKHHPDPVLWEQLRPAVQKLRLEPTQAETYLWELLRNRQLGGYKFRRQHAINRFVVDFYCAQAQLIIEIDGMIHQSQVVEDRERQSILESLGFHVIRFTNEQVLAEPGLVIEQISGYLGRSCPSDQSK